MIGAGSSGIVACKALVDKGLDFDCFEIGSQIGGNWRYDNDNGLSSAYRSLHINTSRERMQYADFPMPEDYPDFADHEQLARYFDAYADHFGLRDRIQFRTEVLSVVPSKGDPSGRWSVTIQDHETGERRVQGYDHVVVANGHHWDPQWPEPAFPGANEFRGLQLHSHDYREPDVLVGKKVVIVGLGNSSCDIAVESSRIAETTLLSVRSGAHVMPKYFGGRPVDTLAGEITGRAPIWLQRRILSIQLKLAVGDPTDYGLPRPRHRLLESHPTISSELLPRLGHGDITVKPNIESFTADTVRFTDGSEEPADLVIYGTGYRVNFPFLDASVLNTAGNQVGLYRMVVPPDQPGLYFIGLIQPLGAVMPLAEAQAKWVADLAVGHAKLPSKRRMKASVRWQRRRMARRYVASKRHTIQVDFFPYLHQLRTEHRRSLRR